MLNSLTTVLVTALGVTALGIALRPGAPTAQVLTAGLNGFANVQRATFGPS